MKVRTGFVSNSSSSSFLIIVKDTSTEPCECCGHVPFSLISAIEDHSRYGYGDESYVECKGTEDVLQRLVDEEYFYMEDEDESKRFRAIEKKLKETDGQPVLLSLDINNELLRRIFDQEAKSGRIEIVWDSYA